MLTAAAPAAAQPPDDGEAASRPDPKDPVREEPDPTRLDVERLPPEAIEITRDLYAHGVFLEMQLGARGFIGGVGRIAKPGFFFSAGLGYEIQRWLWVKASFEGSIHGTDAPAPPSPTAFEVLGFIAELRFQLDFSARWAAWLGGEAGLVLVPTDLLVTYGLNDSDDVGLTYGGQMGIDWHLPSRHHSLGIAGGARVYPSLAGPDGETAVGVRGTAYMRYVF